MNGVKCMNLKSQLARPPLWGDWQYKKMLCFGAAIWSELVYLHMDAVFIEVFSFALFLVVIKKHSSTELFHQCDVLKWRKERQIFIYLLMAAARGKYYRILLEIIISFESRLHLSFGFCCFDSRFIISRRTVSDDVGLVGWAEAEVVQREQRQAPVLGHICQNVQGFGHLEDDLLAVLCKRQVD